MQPRNRCVTDGASGRLTPKSDALLLSEDPSTPQCSPGMPPSRRRSHPHVSFFLPGLPAQGRRAVLPSGSRLMPGRLGSEPRAAHLFLPASAEEERARGTKLCCCSPRWLAPDSPLARFLFTSGWPPLRNLSLSAAVSQALRTNTAAGRAFFVSNLLAQPPRVA